MSETKPTGKRRLLTERRARNAGLVLAGVITLVTFAASSAALGFLWYADTQIERVPEDELRGLEEEPEEPLDPINVLILGSDTREGLSAEEQERKGTPEMVDGERSDTIILAHFDPEEERAVLLHLPRDLLVEIPGHGQEKINAAFMLGGPNLAVRTVHDLTGIPIHHYIEVNFNSFRAIVEALGGVEVCVDRPMIDETAELNLPQAGCYDMDGDTALAFVRARSVEGDLIPDFARIARQQQFIRAVTNKLFSLGSVTRVPDLVRAVAGTVRTDQGLTVTDLLDYGRELEGLAEEDPTGASTVDLRVVPGVAGPSFVEMLPEAEELFRRLREDRPLGDLGTAPSGELPPSPAQIATKVVQAGSLGAASRAEDLLRDAGFIVLARDERPPRATSEIVFAAGAEAQAEVVAGYFPDLPMRQAGPGLLGDADVAVILGRDAP
ncbi:MAG TPA: LCP family protein [Actinomycetota bacterium]|nr:LCP family protein [Actinomycetota bacterium]